jgi:RNA polymerase sigma-70 factor, ECF subfamily
MNMDPAIEDAMVAAIPGVRRFAVSLAGAQQADDLVQQTLLKACSKIRLFELRSEILPWLIAILRNQFYDECRKRGREVEDVDGNFAQTLVTGPDQAAHAELRDLQAHLQKLPKEMRQTLIAVGWEGLSYRDAAQALGCPVGTVRSRVHRARECLAALLHIASPADLRSEPLISAAVAAPT